MPVVPISRHFIYQTVTDVGLAVFKFRNWNLEDYFIKSGTSSHIGAHLAGVTAHARGGELDPCGYVPAVRVAGGQHQPAADGGHTITAGGGQKL